MKKIAEVFKIISDEHRLRILMLLHKKELSVCQVMGITGSSQSLTSRNLSLLYKGGFLEERRAGKLRLYSINKGLSDDKKAIVSLLQTIVKSDAQYREDLTTLKECSAFQKKAGRCDMKTLQAFMKMKQEKNL